LLKAFFLDPSTTSHFNLVFVTAMTQKKETTGDDMNNKVTVDEWVKRFRSIGLDETAMQNWHNLFEKENSDGHQSFLEWLGLPAEKITEIRQKCV
jgi:hypothetical protein